MKVDDIDYYFDIDTGLYLGLLFSNAVMEAEKERDYREIESNEESGNYYITKLDTVTILDETYNDVYVMTNSYIAAWKGKTFNDKGILGVEFLKYYDFLFAVGSAPPPLDGG
ncbi:MAG: hypothetical protein LBP20_02805 [Treponema sp.]|nr:hypothetical protein [Treponema sp.]